MRERIKKLGRFVLLLFVFLGTVLFYSRYVEPNLLTRTEITLPCPQWAPGTDQVKIVFIADFHLKPGEQARLKSIINRVVDEHPDLVLLGGDYYNGHRLPDSMHPSEMAALLEPLANSIPVLAVMGNHELYCGTQLLRAAFERIGILFMERQSQLVNINGRDIQIAGIPDMTHKNRLQPDDIPQRKSPAIPMLALTHSPDAIRHIPGNVDATLTGHTHGGQICLPGGIPLTAPIQIGTDYAYGDLLYDNKRLIVTRGLGCSILPLRLFCPPEIMVLNLVPAGK